MRTNRSAASMSMGMPPKLRGGQLGVFQESDRRQAGEATHLVAHVRLARVAGRERPRGQRLVGGGHQAPQPSDPREQLGPVADRA